MNDMTFYRNSVLANEWEFPISTVSLQTDSGIAVPEDKARAIIRTDTNQILGVHGKKYNALTHSEVVNKTMQAVTTSGISKEYETKIELFDNGAKMRGSILFNDLVIEPQVGDIIKFQITFYNSYDGSWSFQQQAYGLRLWCLNGCTDKHTVASTIAKHTKNISVTGSSAKIQAGLDTFFQQKAVYLSWMNTHVSDEMAETFFKYKLCRIKTNTSEMKYNHKRLEELMGFWLDEKGTLGRNKWALYNACTYWATHTGKSKSPAATRRNNESLLAKALSNPMWHNY